MSLTKTERLICAFLVILLAVGSLVLIARFSRGYSNNRRASLQIQQTAALTDTEVPVKSVWYDEEENKTKLNLNRTNEKSIQALPGMTKSYAKKIYDFVTVKGGIRDMDDLLEIKGFTRKRLGQLEKYATVHGGHSGEAAWGDKVNLNFATVDDLRTLPGIGKKMAEKILEFRNNNGGFRSVDELRDVPGLSDEKVEQLRDKVKVN